MRSTSSVASQAPSSRSEWTPPKPHYASPQLRNADGLPRSSPSSQVIRFGASTSTPPPSHHPYSRGGPPSSSTSSSPAASPSLFPSPLPRHAPTPAPRSSAFSWTDSSVDGGSATILDFPLPARSTTPATPERRSKTSAAVKSSSGATPNQYPPPARSGMHRQRGSSASGGAPPMPLRGWSFDSVRSEAEQPLPPSQALRAFHDSSRSAFEPSHHKSSSIFVDSDEEEERLMTSLVDGFFGRGGARGKAQQPTASPSSAKRGLFGLPKASPTSRLRTLSDASSRVSRTTRSGSDDGHQRAAHTSPLMRPARLLTNLASSHMRTRSNASTASASTVASSAISFYGNGAASHGHCSDSSSSTCTGASHHRAAQPLKSSEITVRQVGQALGVGLGVGAPLRLDENGQRRFDGAEVVRRPQYAFVSSHRPAPTIPSAVEVAIHVPVVSARASTPPFSDLIEAPLHHSPSRVTASPRPLLVYDPKRRPRRPLLAQAMTAAPAPLPKSPPLPPAPSRMEAWRELLRPQAAKELPPPNRPRRPSEAVTTISDRPEPASKNPLSPRSRLAAAVRRGPRPQRAPIPSYSPPTPPPPKNLFVITSRGQAGEESPLANATDDTTSDSEKARLERKESERKTKGLLIALGMRQPKLSVSHADAGTCTEDEEERKTTAMVPARAKAEVAVMTDGSVPPDPTQPLLLAPPSPSQWRRQRRSMAAARRSAAAQPRNSILSHGSTPSDASPVTKTRPADASSCDGGHHDRSCSPSSSSDDDEDDEASRGAHLSRPFSLSSAHSAEREAELAHTSFLALDASDPLSPTSASSQQLLFDIQTSPRTTKTNGLVSQGLLSPLLTSSQVAEHRLRSASPYRRRCPSNVDSDEEGEDDDDDDMWMARDPRAAALA